METVLLTSVEADDNGNQRKVYILHKIFKKNFFLQVRVANNIFQWLNWNTGTKARPSPPEICASTGLAPLEVVFWILRASAPIITLSYAKPDGERFTHLKLCPKSVLLDIRSLIRNSISTTAPL